MFGQGTLRSKNLRLPQTLTLPGTGVGIVACHLGQQILSLPSLVSGAWSKPLASLPRTEQLHPHLLLSIPIHSGFGNFQLD